MLTQPEASGCVIGWSDFSRQPAVENIVFWICGSASVIDLLLFCFPSGFLILFSGFFRC